MSDSVVKELVEKIHQFLSHQIETNSELSEAARESLTVAAECIEQAYMIQKKPASSELFDMYTSSRNNSSSSSNTNNGNPAQFIQNLANSILSTASASVSANNPAGQTDTRASQASATTSAPAPAPAPRVRKNATEAEKMAAESYKNQGNDFMKQDKYKEAYDCYTQAINIDDNNAIYYSNRAAASSKLGDHHAALKDCQESVSIDSNYSKAYGRMGLAYASLDDHQKAKEAYVKAVELDPQNESYRNNLKIAEEKLASAEASNAGGAQNNMMSIFRSMMSNPEVMSMAMRSLQDPRLQSLFTGQQQTSNQNQPQATSQQQNAQTDASATNPAEGATNNQPSAAQSPADLLNLTSRLASSANIDIVGAGQQLLSSIGQTNPELVNNMRRMMNQAFMPPNQNDSDRNPPPGYS